MEGLGLVQDFRRVTAFRARAAAIEGEAQVEGRTVTLRIEVDRAPSVSLPRFYLRPWDALGFLPHVCPPDGFVCFTDSEGVVLNRREPLLVVAEGFRRALRLLADGITGRNHADFADEFETYWGWLGGGEVAFSLLEPGDTVERVSVTVEREQQNRALFVASNDAQLASFLNGKPPEASWRTQPGLYVPLESGTRLTPPRPDGPFWTVAQARDILWAGLSGENRDRLVELTRTERRDTEFVIVRLPRPLVGTTLFGIRYDGTDRRHPLRPWGSAKRVTPLNLTRVDRGYLVARGGASTDLGPKRVLLVGCGSVGGHLAFELARAGVSDLTLVDPDRLTPENWYRHVLGRGHWNQLKVIALQGALEAQLPYMKVTAVDKTIQAALAEGAVRLSHFDLVVLALGNPTLELDINERLHVLNTRRPALFTWLEPFGIGGHALLVGSGQAGGCFECLYSPVGDDEETLENRASFAAPGQTFAKSLTGCAGLYTPYGSIDAVRTAALAARLAIDSLTGRQSGSPLLSWKGSPDDFERAGYKLSSRFGMSEEALERQRYAYRSDRCRVCQPERGEA